MKFARFLRSLREELEGFAEFLEKTPGFFLVSFSIVYFIGGLGLCLHRKLWLDEIISGYIITLPALKDIWAALLNTVDGNPPLYYLMARPFLRVFRTDIAIRLPATIGFWIAAVCVFSFVRRHASTLAGAIAALLFVGTGAFRWATEGRPYGPMLGLMGIALVLWQRSADHSRNRLPWLAGLALAMACLVATHYYSILLVVPLFLGEVARAAVRRRWDWPLYAAATAGTATILLWLPLIRSLRENVSNNAATKDYFAQPSLASLYGSYAALAYPVVVPVLLCASIIVICMKYDGGRVTVGEHQAAAPETAVAVGLAATPAVGLALALLATHTFVERYVLAGALGMGMLGGLLVHQTLGGRRSGGVLVFLVMFGSFSGSLLPGALGRDDSYDAALASLGATDGRMPIVVPEGLLFAPLWYYAPATLRGRLFYLTDLETAEKTTDTTNENIMIRMKPFAPESIAGLDTFVAAHRTFFLYYSGGSANSSLDALMNRQCNISLVRKEAVDLLFLCQCAGRK